MYTIWRTGHPINEEVTRALRIGSLRLSDTHEGFTVLHVDERKKDLPINASIAYGILRGTGDIFHACDTDRKEWWEVDRGYFKPKHYDGYYRISLQGTRARYVPEVADCLPDDRWNALGINLAPWRSADKGCILLVPPTEPVAEFYGFDRNQWINEYTAKLRDKTDRRIVLREKDTTVPLQYALADCYCVVTYNSNVALEALIRGVPAIGGNCEIKHWNGFGVHNINDDLRRPDRLKLFRFLSYCQFTLEEFNTGYAWKTANDIQKYGGLY